MSRQGTIRRYSLILETLSVKAFPTFRDFQKRLSDAGFEVSHRTVQRDLEQIRVEFGLEIVFDRTHGGYKVDEDSSLDVDSFLRILQLGSTADLLIRSLAESRETLKYLDVEDSGQLRGIEHLPTLLGAIRERQVLRIDYGFFGSSEVRSYTLKPQLLKEYQRRWYVVALVDSRKGYRTFGLDRIRLLEPVNRTFERESGIDPKEPFRHTIGLNYSVDEPKHIRISCTHLQAEYLDALPIHHSQIKLSDTDTEVEYGFHLVPNYEFTQRLLMMAGEMTVLEPESLRLMIVSIFRHGLQRHGLS